MVFHYQISTKIIDEWLYLDLIALLVKVMIRYGKV